MGNGWLFMLSMFTLPFLGSFVGGRIAFWMWRREEARLKLMIKIMAALRNGDAHAPLVAERLSLNVHKLHPLLRTLERKGLIEHREEPGGPERGGRPRIVYSVRR